MPGTLFLVATPIGNLEDITLRAVRVLGEADLIACEDTRHTGRLLDHLQLRKPMVSYHEHNEASRAGELIDRMKQGSDVALVSDAGTPLISDPGFRLVSQAVEAGIPVTPIPGPSAVTAALAASGLPSDSFLFLGFVPQKAGSRRKALEQVRDLPVTLILYEAPHRMLETLSDLTEILGDRPLVAAREVTKLHEEFLRGTADSIRNELEGRPAVKGEFTLVVGPPIRQSPTEIDAESARRSVEELVENGSSRMDAIKATSRRFGVPKRVVYDLVERGSE